MSADNLDERFNSVVEGLTFDDANENTDGPYFCLVDGHLHVNIPEHLGAVIAVIAEDVACSARELDAFTAFECAPQVHDNETNQAQFAMSYGPQIVASNVADLEAVACINQHDTVELSVGFQWCRGLNMMRLLMARAEQGGAVPPGPRALCDAVLSELLEAILD